MEIILIVAMAANRVIGRNNDIPWHLPGEQQRFKELTMGHTLLMGRRTYQSIGRPLPGRKTIIISRQADYSEPGAVISSPRPCPSPTPSTSPPCTARWGERFFFRNFLKRISAKQRKR